MEYVKYISGGTVLFFGVSILLLNCGRQISNYRHRSDEEVGWSSPVPVIGPLLCVFGYKLLPIEFNYNVFWVFVFDADTVFVIMAVPVLVLQFLKKKKE
jgi:hypothetical protein